MTDVEKRWNDPLAIRSASFYVLGVIAAALLVMGAIVLWAGLTRDQCAPDSEFVCNGTQRVLLALLPAAVLLIGTITGFIRTYLVWRAGGRWPIWQAAGWALMVSTLLYITLSAGMLGSAS
ncbi:MAG: hypothetical protein GX542_01570 [Rhodococcus sp.]|nr:hypothetical protein [Rhodococcus sp. (in: high G+C Gram-positive bacteria)]